MYEVCNNSSTLLSFGRVSAGVLVWTLHFTLQLGRVQKSATEVVRGAEPVTCEEGLKGLGGFVLAKRSLRGDMITLFKYVNGCCREEGHKSFPESTRVGQEVIGLNCSKGDLG